MKRNLIYAVGYLAVLFFVGKVFEWIFPNNHAYASLASWFTGFIYAAYFFPDFAKITSCYLLYFAIALISSLMDLGWLGSHDTAGSVMFPAIAGVVTIAPLLITLLTKIGVTKIKSLRRVR